MAKFGFEFNVNDVPEREDYTPLPAGDYTAMIIASTMKPSSKNIENEYLEMEIEVMEGAHSGRKLFERLNLKNDNAQTVEIAYKTLAEITRAIGKVTINDSDELHNKRMVVQVDVEAGKPYTKDGVTKQGNAQNRIKRYKPLGTAMQSSAAPAVGATTGAPLPPWKR